MSKPKTVTKERTKQTTPKRGRAKREDTPLTLAKAGLEKQAAATPIDTTQAATLIDEPDDLLEPLPEETEEDEQLDEVLEELHQRVESNGHHDEPNDPLQDYPWDEPWENSFGSPIEQVPEASAAVISGVPVEPVPKLVEPAGSLIVHCGTRKITRDELAIVTVPEATRTHQPLAHHRIIEALVESLAFRHIYVVREEYAVSPDGARMFGVLDLDAEWNGLRFSIGLRNSNDKSMRLGMTIGYRVLVCDNMSFQGDFAPVFHKHTRKLELLDVISIGVDKMQRGFPPLKIQIGEWQQRLIADDAARLTIYRAFLEERFPRTIMSEVHRCYFKPQYDEFKPRTLWSLSNAFTSAFKLLKPVRQFTATAKLGAYIETQRTLFSQSSPARLVA